jgi:hypothetical protein
MTLETPLTDQEKRYLNALRLFMERNGDPENLEDGKMLDELSPKQARAVIGIYHTWLEDPQAFDLAYKIYLRILPILDAWTYIKDIFVSHPRA